MNTNFFTTSALTANSVPSSNYQVKNSENSDDGIFADLDDDLKTTQDMYADKNIVEKSTEHLGTDEEALADIVTEYLNNDQLQEFDEVYGGDLKKQLLQETNDKNASQFINTMFDRNTVKPFNVYTDTGRANAAESLHDAMYKAGTDEKALIDILANPNYSKEELQAIIEEYDNTYAEEEGKTFIEKLDSETSGFFNELVMSRIE